MANLLHETARAHWFNFQIDECRELCGHALEMAERVGAIDVQADTLITQGLLPDLPTEETLMIFEQAIEVAESAGLLYHAARAHNNLGVVTTFQAGNLSSGVEHFRQAADLSRKIGNASFELFVASNATSNQLLLGYLDEAEEELSVQKQMLESIYDPGPSELNLKVTEVSLSRYRGELEEAIEKLRILSHEAEAVGDLQTLSSLDLNLGVILLEVSEEDEAEIFLLEAMELFDRLATLGRVATRSILSMKETQLGNYQEAHRWLDEAREKETEPGAVFFDTSWRLIAERRLAVAERNWPEAWEAFEEFMRMVEKSGMRWYRAQALREWAEAHLAHGEPGDEERARELLLESQAEFEDMGAPIYAAQVKEVLSGLD
jgi:tetratricopeptide (TPR) repeat protein